MLDPVDRFFAPSGDIYPGGPSTWRVIDWDQRRLISVTMDEELESEDPAFEHLLKHIDDLAPDVYEIHVSSQGDLISASSDPKDDDTRCAYCPPLDALELPKDIQVVSRSDLQELDRLGPNVDLVVCPSSPEPTKKLVFKYYFIGHHLRFSYHEMSLWIRLPEHPHIVPFDKLVVDEFEGRFVGFTALYIPGGTLDENKTRVFKLKWLHQLIDVIDELNLNLGISHHDVAPRNLLVDEAKDSLMLFDFNFSARIGQPEYSDDRNDIKGVIFTMYEIITRNDDLRAVRHEEQDLSAIEHQDWVKHPEVLLDHPVLEFRKVLDEWSEKRRGGKQITAHTEAPNFIDWPPFPPPTIDEVHTMYVGQMAVKAPLWLFDQKRTVLRELGRPILKWQRLPRSALKKGGLVEAMSDSSVQQMG